MESFQVFKRTINYYETDRMQVVHHSNYIRFLEECRMHFMNEIGLDYAEMEQRGVIVPVLSVSCDFVNPVRFGDAICIVPKLEKLSVVRFEMSYTIYSEDFKTIHNHATSSHCFLGDDFKPVRMKRDYADIYEKLQAVEGKELYIVDTSLEK